MGLERIGSVVILCGGRGTRLQEHTASIPKPLVEIGGRPILWHVMQIYAVQGLRRFVLCTGYKGEQIERFVSGTEWPEDIDVACIDTGLDTPTGGRIHRVRDHVGEGTFCATYADGVADLDLAELVAYHERHGDTGTMTVVRPELQFGVTELDGNGRVSGFHEKPRSDHWINGGFFCFEQRAFDYLTDSSVLEREPLEGMADERQLHAYRHTGFWECMDTYKDAVQLNDLWERGDPPWKVWP
ncbi:MAG: sugar phosphate nucleotidyltransferase [Thermoleophilaceae bacterium]